MPTWLQKLLTRTGLAPRPIPEALWQRTLQHYPFWPPCRLPTRHSCASSRAASWQKKEFTGAHGLEVTDAMAVAIAAQACLPVIRIGLKYYNDFTGIVVHPGAMVARREVTDAAGVVHHYREVLAGEAMQHGPVTLSWEDASTPGDERGHNVVIHEFVHKLDMYDGAPNGAPPLPSRAARAQWQAVMQAAFEGFRRQVTMAERFGAEWPWLDAYGATSPVEFFAVASEAYFVNRERFSMDFAPLTALFDQFYRPKVAVAP